MKTGVFAFILTVFFAFRAFQELSVIGKWQNEDGTRTVEFYPSGSLIDGRIINDKNPDFEGKVIFTKLKFDGKAYQGSCYLPKRKRTVHCSLKLTSANTLAITGKAGMISDTKIWKRK